MPLVSFSRYAGDSPALAIADNVSISFFAYILLCPFTIFLGFQPQNAW